MDGTKVCCCYFVNLAWRTELVCYYYDVNLLIDAAFMFVIIATCICSLLAGWLDVWELMNWYIHVCVCACVLLFVQRCMCEMLLLQTERQIIITKRPVPILIMISIFFSVSIKHQKCRLGSEFDGINKTIEQTALSVTPWWTPKHLPPSLSHVCGGPMVWKLAWRREGRTMKNSAQVIVYTETVTEKHRSTRANTSPPQW